VKNKRKKLEVGEKRFGELKYSPYLCLIKQLSNMSITKEITSTDVLKVAKTLGKELSDSKVTQVLEMYDGEADNDPTATWDLIVENCLYNLEN